MASEDIAQLADSLAKTQVVEGELSYKGKGLKLDSAQAAEELVREIEQFPGLQALRLEGNTVGVEAAQAIAKALESKGQLQRCYWSDMFTGRLRAEIPPALTSLGAALMTAGARLTELDLSDNAFGPDGVRGIEELLKSASCYTLRELRLNNCGMGIGGGKILAAALTECHRRSGAQGAPLRLRVFVAGRNRLENDGATALAQAFKLMGSLEEIHMPQNGINHSGVTALATALKDNPQLRVLNLNDNTFTKKGAMAMAEALKHLRCVQVINFGDCLVRSEGAIAIAETLRSGLPILKELNLSFGEIAEEAALQVAQAVQHKDQLERLDLNGNYLGEEGCEALREAMNSMNMGDRLASLSDDEGEPEEEEDEEDVEEEEEEEEEEEGNEEEEEEDDDGETETRPQIEEQETPVSVVNEIQVSTIVPSPFSAEVCSFLDSPSADKLLKLGEEAPQLIKKQVNTADAGRTAEAFLKIASLLKDETPLKRTLLDSIDALLGEAFSCSSFQSGTFISTILVLLGLIKSEDKVKPMRLVPGHLLALEHAVKQDYFPGKLIDVLDAFVSRPSAAADSYPNARVALQKTLLELIDLKEPESPPAEEPHSHA